MKAISRLTVILVILSSVAFFACYGSDNGNNDSGTSDDAVVNISAITGVTPPVYGETPVTAITETDQYTGTVSWLPDDDTFAAVTSYAATITLNAKTGYTFTGVPEYFFTVDGAASVANDTGSGVVTAVFPATVYEAGDSLSYSLPSGIVFNMKYVPGGLAFPTGTDDAGSSTINTPYWIGETEVTYELWFAVRTWARAHGYTLNTNPGCEGNDGKFKYNEGADPTTAKYEPVTSINWREAMVWCNALTEYYNANNGTAADLDCVYYTDSAYATPIRSADGSGSFSSTSGGQDNPYVKSSAQGFRLQTSDEWECAARWRNDATNTVSGYADPYFTKGNSLSGATTYYNDVTGSPDLAGKLACDAVAVYRWYFNGSEWIVNGTFSTAEVKSKGSGGANALGLYDMSGNVWEWCFDLFSGSYRVIRGGGWNDSTDRLQVGNWTGIDPYSDSNVLGFRFARSQ